MQMRKQNQQKKVSLRDLRCPLPALVTRSGHCATHWYFGAVGNCSVLYCFRDLSIDSFVEQVFSMTGFESRLMDERCELLTEVVSNCWLSKVFAKLGVFIGSDCCFAILCAPDCLLFCTFAFSFAISRSIDLLIETCSVHVCKYSVASFVISLKLLRASIYFSVLFYFFDLWFFIFFLFGFVLWL